MLKQGEEKSDPSVSATASTPEDNDMPTPSVSGCSLWVLFDRERDKSQMHRISSTDAHVKIRRYMEEIITTRNEDPLKWWHGKEETLQNMSRIARKYLSTVATSVPSERLFSKAGEVISHRRSRLKPSNVDMILFLNGYFSQSDQFQWIN
ncbi:hypothetical protein Pcinc_027667 [Petrolisthes cinctipes]|uniref:HAT C-terminal dimerisation domain-containing protein n=1 Tax=Petrolisthes cinctipes TaxID=88211 RepID=A0AAE1F5I3_PETCI|nr:hypothetical protein Pcinc_027667 [Petrolisthes cinctipes]